MHKLNQTLAALQAALKAAPQHTCQRCGNQFGPMPAPQCYDCDQADIAATNAAKAELAALERIDPRFRTATFAGYACPPGDAQARDDVQGWGPSLGRGLYLSGQPGAGKSHLAFALARELAADGWTIFAAEWTALLKRIKATFGDGARETEADIWRAIERADVVLVDDLMTGRERPTDWAVEQCWQVVQNRYASEKPLVVTANYDLGGLATRIGGIDGNRIASRLAEMTFRVEVRAEDFRTANARRTA